MTGRSHREKPGSAGNDEERKAQVRLLAADEKARDEGGQMAGGSWY